MVLLVIRSIFSRSHGTFIRYLLYFQGIDSPFPRNYLQIWQGGGDGSDVAKIENIAVQCEKTFIKVEVKFDRPFSGMIYSKGHYSDQGG